MQPSGFHIWYNLPGQVPFISFHAYGLENLKKGTIEFNVLVYLFNKELPEEDTGEMATILDNPAIVKNSALKNQETPTQKTVKREEN